jgi:hypothetical protein
MKVAERKQVVQALSGALTAINLLTVYGQKGPKTYEKIGGFEADIKDIFARIHAALKILEK